LERTADIQTLLSAIGSRELASTKTAQPHPCRPASADRANDAIGNSLQRRTFGTVEEQPGARFGATGGFPALGAQGKLAKDRLACTAGTLKQNKVADAGK